MSTLNLLVLLTKLSLDTISSHYLLSFIHLYNPNKMFFSFNDFSFNLSFHNLFLAPVPLLIFLNRSNLNCELNSSWSLTKSFHNAASIFFSAGNIVPGTQSCTCWHTKPSTIAVFFCRVVDSQPASVYPTGCYYFHSRVVNPLLEVRNFHC